MRWTVQFPEVCVCVFVQLMQVFTGAVMISLLAITMVVNNLHADFVVTLGLPVSQTFILAVIHLSVQLRLLYICVLTLFAYIFTQIVI